MVGRRITAVLAALVVAGAAALAPTAAVAGTQRVYKTKAFNSTYFASMDFSSAAHFNKSGSIAYQDDALSRGGVYAHGPYGAYGVAAKLVRHKWTILLDSNQVQDCSIGVPMGFSCTLSATGGNVRLVRASGFGAS